MPLNLPMILLILLLDRHQITDSTKADFQITSVEALLSSVSAITK